MTRPVIVALDLDNEKKLNALLPKLGKPENVFIKIGMELFFNEGPAIVRNLSEQGYQIFLDLKMSDIPNTVYNGAKALAQLGITYTTVHALGGSQMIKAEKEGLIAGTPVGKNIPKLLAETAKKAGADGVICSPLEVKNLRQNVGDDFLYVTPGIRPAGNAKDDQSRVATPAQAKEWGSTAIVVGRPITLATNPEAAYEAIKKEFN